MKKLIDCISEAKMSKPDFIRYGRGDTKTYSIYVINKLLNDGYVRLSKDGEHIMVLDDFDKDMLLDLKDYIEDTCNFGEEFTKQDCVLLNTLFNNCIRNKQPHFKWINIFRGDFTGKCGTRYVNCGKSFEKFFYKYFHNYVHYLEKIIDEKDVVMIEYIGNQRVRRPLMLSGNDLIVNNGETFEDIGKKIADIIITTRDGEHTYISLKSKLNKNKSSLHNGSISGIKLEDIINDGEVDIDNLLNHQIFNKIIEIFGIDVDILQQSLKSSADNHIDFTDYLRQHGGDFKENKNMVTKHPTVNIQRIKNYLKSCIGYNYLFLEEQPDSSIMLLDLRKKNKLDNLLDICNVEVDYSFYIDFRVTVKIQTKYIDFKIVLRTTPNKDKNLHSFRCDCEYNIKKNLK